MQGAACDPIDITSVDFWTKRKELSEEERAALTKHPFPGTTQDVSAVARNPKDGHSHMLATLTH